jgi:hypothetical protein
MQVPVLDLFNTVRVNALKRQSALFRFKYGRLIHVNPEAVVRGCVLESRVEACPVVLTVLIEKVDPYRGTWPRLTLELSSVTTHHKQTLLCALLVHSVALINFDMRVRDYNYPPAAIPDLYIHALDTTKSFVIKLKVLVFI